MEVAPYDSMMSEHPEKTEATLENFRATVSPAQQARPLGIYLAPIILKFLHYSVLVAQLSSELRTFPIPHGRGLVRYIISYKKKMVI